MATKSVNLGKVKGEDAKINGVNTLTMVEGDGINISQSGSTLTISVDTDNVPTDNSNKPITSDGVYEAIKNNYTLYNITTAFKD